MSKVFGKATVLADGEQLPIDRPAKLELGGVRRNVVTGSEVHGFAEESLPSVVEVEATIKSGQSLKAWGDIDNATITFEMDTGQTYILRNAWVENPPVATAGEGGRVPLRFVSTSCEELANG